MDKNTAERNIIPLPVDFREGCVLSHNAEHLVVHFALVLEIMRAYQVGQPPRSFHAGMDEDGSFDSRPADLLLQWVDTIYKEITSRAELSPRTFSTRSN